MKIPVKDIFRTEDDKFMVEVGADGNPMVPVPKQTDYIRLKLLGSWKYIEIAPCAAFQPIKKLTQRAMVRITKKWHDFKNTVNDQRLTQNA